MSKNYFVYRSGEVHGPFTSEQICSGLDKGKIKNTDTISDSSSGPWQSIESFEASQPPAIPTANEAPQADADLFSQLPPTVGEQVSAFRETQPRKFFHTTTQPANTSKESQDQHAATPPSNSYLQDAEADLMDKEKIEAIENSLWNRDLSLGLNLGIYWHILIALLLVPASSLICGCFAAPVCWWSAYRFYKLEEPEIALVYGIAGALVFVFGPLVWGVFLVPFAA